MSTAFSTTSITSQLPVLTRRRLLLKRIMWAGIGLAIACLIPTVYFAYSAAAVNSVSSFAYDFPKGLITWSYSLPNVDKSTVEYFLKAKMNNLIIILTVVTVAGLGILTVMKLAIGDPPETVFSLLGLSVGAVLIFNVVNGVSSDSSDDLLERLSIAYSERDAPVVLDTTKSLKQYRPDLLISLNAGAADATDAFDDLGYLGLQRELKKDHADASKAKRFIRSSYFRRNSETFSPDVLTAIEKAAYGAPVSERAKHYQASVIKPEVKKKFLLSGLSASLMFIAVLTGISAFLMSRAIRKRVALLKTLFSNESKA